MFLQRVIDGFWFVLWPAPARNFRSASGIPNLSNVFLISAGTSSQLRDRIRRLDVVVNIFKIDILKEWTSPGWHWFFSVNFVRLQTEIEHPLRLLLYAEIIRTVSSVSPFPDLNSYFLRHEIHNDSRSSLVMSCCCWVAIIRWWLREMVHILSPRLRVRDPSSHFWRCVLLTWCAQMMVRCSWEFSDSA